MAFALYHQQRQQQQQQQQQNGAYGQQQQQQLLQQQQQQQQQQLPMPRMPFQGAPTRNQGMVFDGKRMRKLPVDRKHTDYNSTVLNYVHVSRLRTTLSKIHKTHFSHTRQSFSSFSL